MAATFPQAPTYAEPIIDLPNGKSAFNPIWIQWFLDYARILQNTANGVYTSHESLQNLLGGAANDHYHMKQVEQIRATTGISQPLGTFTAPATGASVRNTTSWDVLVIPSGGGGTTYAYSRDNATFYSIANPPVIYLAKNDYLQVTYSVAPTLNYFPV